ncbi:hypothetical protein [Fibrella forsythiae]|uniref:Zinc-finger domain-containing protein n=1 Tax=Fibrella forsythiae TaxID=2817061 RepID=A0ABS3JHA5_9BACT|nr:hypothetical protein [Fibrella forsythiae]MBO0948793.1 hypothetical protein [Fibrella forsythiae]
MNRHSSTYHPADQLTLDDLRAYQADQLSGPARHRVERLMLENPFYADALEGLDAFQQQVGGSLKAQTRELHLALQERVHESATTRRLMPLWVTSLAASVLLVLAVSIYLIFNSANSQKKATQAVRVLPQHIEPGTVLIDPADLGTSEVGTTMPKAQSLVAKRSQEKPQGQPVKMARKSHRGRAKRPVVLVEDAASTISSDCTFCVMADDIPSMPQFNMNVPARRTVNTERAFLN